MIALPLIMLKIHAYILRNIHVATIALPLIMKIHLLKNIHAFALYFQTRKLVHTDYSAPSTDLNTMFSYYLVELHMYRMVLNTFVFGFENLCIWGVLILYASLCFLYELLTPHVPRMRIYLMAV